MKFQAPYKLGVGILANQEIYFKLILKTPAKIESLQKEMQEEIESHSRIQGPGKKD